jgi:beta propeller repeat protein
MRISRPLRLITFCALITLLLPSGPVSAVTSVGQGGSPQASAPFALAEGAGSQVWPSLAGTQMVYANCTGSNCDIWRLDLYSRKAVPLTENATLQEQPDTDGTWAVWSEGAKAKSRDFEDRTNDFAVKGSSLLSAGMGGFDIDNRNGQARPRVWGNFVVWNDFRDAKGKDDQEAGDIYVYDIAAKRETLITNARSAQTRPATNGKVVVWVDYRNEPSTTGFNSDIYGYDLTTKQEFVVTRAPDQQTEPALYGNMVVWSDFRKGSETDADLYGYDLTTKQEFLISGAAGTQANPGIWGNVVVWEDCRNDTDKANCPNRDIYGYDLIAKREFPIFVGQGYQGAPRVAGNTVAWEENLNPQRPDWNIKGATLSGISFSAPPVPLPGAGSTAFKETGKTVGGLFLDYWQRNGGLAQQGFPISEVMGEISDTDGKLYTVQYFERAVFEYHPEQADARYKVLLSLLGNQYYRQRYPLGAPNQRPNTQPGSVQFRETGKRLGGKFLDYWNRNGGLAQQGFPISDEFTEVSDLDGKPYTVQYFERAVFELHPENAGTPYEVLLSQLGRFQLRAKYGER